MVLVVLVDEEFEIGEFYGGEDEGFGVDAGFQGVHGGGGLAGDRGRAGGFLGRCGGSLLFVGEWTYGWLRVCGQAGGLSYF